MEDVVSDPLDQPRTRAAMARECGASQSTLRNWSMRKEGPLETIDDGDIMLYTWRHLLTFCRANPKLTATAAIFEHYRKLTGDSAAGQDSPLLSETARPSTSRPVASSPYSRGNEPETGATLRSALEDLKTQIEDHASLVAAAAKLAQDTARIHRGLAESVRALESAAGNHS